ncbi:MAG: NirF protein [Nitrospirae bacterium]|nr:NirF protein [Nitrospirota bacterium]
MHYLLILIMLLASVNYAAAEKLYVVEREREAIAVVDNGKVSEIENLGSMNHALVKFDAGAAYVVGRDGFFSHIDTKTDKLVKRVKVGSSGIGFTSCNDYIAVANYDPKDVVILDRKLNIAKKIETGSRNVGIKCLDNLLVFSLMDKDEIWVLDAKKDFKQVKAIKTGGEMPFDALLTGDTYVAGFFKGGVALLDLKDFKYNEKIIMAGQQTVFKIPHFGTWGVAGQRAYIPAVGENKLIIIDTKDYTYTGSIELTGLPVFVVVSPDGKYLAVNYSGDKDNYVTIIDLKDNKVLKNIDAGKRIMHLRFSGDGKTLYASAYFENMVKTIGKDTWAVRDWVSVPTPSGIFIVQ